MALDGGCAAQGKAGPDAARLMLDVCDAEPFVSVKRHGALKRVVSCSRTVSRLSLMGL